MMLMLRALLIASCMCYMHAQQTEITPYKFKHNPYEVKHVIPTSSRFTINRPEPDAPEIVYYCTKPHRESYPITILCTGSSNKDTLGTVMPLHRYFLQELLDVGSALITVEQWGIDGYAVDKDAFMKNYTRTQRFIDHQTVIEHIRSAPLEGWDGTFIFIGISEGGLLVTRLSELYADNVRATINWSGASAWAWDDELWEWIIHVRQHGPWYYKLYDRLPEWLKFSGWTLPKTRATFDACMQRAMHEPIADKEFIGMAYLYHADALCYPLPNYAALKKPFLVVAGAQDGASVGSSDLFVQRAQEASVPITYMRVEGMDHYVRKRPDVIEQSFAWLKEQLS